MTVSEWLTLLGSAATLAAAGVAAFVAHRIGTSQTAIARQQAEAAEAEAKTAKSKLKLDLFERRYELYELTVRTIDGMGIGSEDDGGNDLSFLFQLRKARWVFGEDVHQFLHKTIWPTIVKFRLAQMDLKAAVESQDRFLAAQKLTEVRTQLLALSGEADALFAPYIQLEG